MKAYQTPLVDGNGNGVPNEPEDYAAAAEIIFSPDSGVAGDIPVIKNVPDKMSIFDTNSATLSATVDDEDGIARVWAEIAPVGHKQWLS